MKNKLIIVLFTAILQFILFNALAQKNFFEGYIITNKRDTIFGQIKDRKNGTFVKLYKKIKFKPDVGFRKLLSPNSIQAYKIGNQKFVTMEIKDEIKLFKRKVTVVPNSNNKEFVRVISEGYLALYEKEYIDDSGLSSVYYFKKTDENDMVFVRTGLFGLNKNRLAVYFEDCPELAEKILNKGIKNPRTIVRFYNNWCGGN
ncbi:MAG: hypothetical protein L3J35_12835 [Bacteroidales bacterium]|nr:hypothetical protein [Bacteroidales bacterium]